MHYLVHYGDKSCSESTTFMVSEEFEPRAAMVDFGMDLCNPSQALEFKGFFHLNVYILIAFV